MGIRVLVVEDEARIADFLVRGLREEGFTVEHAADGDSAALMLRASEWDVLLLDWRLPGMEGIEVLRRFREHNRGTPALFLTARDTVADRVEGFASGGDDYLVKPFAVPELVARVRSLCRRSATVRPPVHRVGDLEIDEPRHRVSVRGHNVNLTPMEFELLYFLAANAGQVFDRETLFREVWGYDYVGETNLVDVCVRRLREKVEVEPSRPRIIVTVRGVGYKLAEP